MMNIIVLWKLARSLQSILVNCVNIQLCGLGKWTSPPVGISSYHSRIKYGLVHNAGQWNLYFTDTLLKYVFKALFFSSFLCFSSSSSLFSPLLAISSLTSLSQAWTLNSWPDCIHFHGELADSQEPSHLFTQILSLSAPFCATSLFSFSPSSASVLGDRLKCRFWFRRNVAGRLCWPRATLWKGRI